MAGDFIAQLRTECTNMPAINYLAQWANMSSSTLAYTYTFFTQSGSPPCGCPRINSKPTSTRHWWDGSCHGSGHYDLKSTMLHEVLHGVGVVSRRQQAGLPHQLRCSATQEPS